MTDLATTIRLAKLAAEFQDAQAVKLFGFSPPLTDEQLASLSKSDRYRDARRAVLATPSFAGITGKAFSELVYAGRKLHVWEAIKKDIESGAKKLLRPIKTPKSLASAIRDVLDGTADKTKVVLAPGELDEAQQVIAANVKKLNKPSQAVFAIIEGAKKDPAFLHDIAVSLIEEVRHLVNDELVERNVDLWAKPKGAFLNSKTVGELFRLPKGATLDSVRKSSRMAAENAMADRQRADEKRRAAKAKARREAKKAAAAKAEPAGTREDDLAAIARFNATFVKLMRG